MSLNTIRSLFFLPLVPHHGTPIYFAVCADGPYRRFLNSESSSVVGLCGVEGNQNGHWLVSILTGLAFVLFSRA